jgi:hypothetical protein
VVFGTEENFHKEKISFEIVDFKCPYHCILGWTAFTKFMARPCYTYNRMKISGPYMVIDVLGDLSKAIECEEDCAEEADVAAATQEADVATIADQLKN